MKKSMQNVIVALSIVLLAGCASTGKWLDKNVGNDNGVFDPNVSVAWKGTDGKDYAFAYDQDGIRIEVKFVIPGADGLYIETTGKGVSVTHPRTGATVILAPDAK